jgi:hypothetical protein
MPEFKVTFARHVIEWHTVYVERESLQAVIDAYDNGELPDDENPDSEITNESDFNVEPI